jgi:hypothetical protein
LIIQNNRVRPGSRAAPAQTQSKDYRIAAALLAKARSIDVLRQNIPELQVVATQELGIGVGLQFEILAKESGLLPSPRDRLIADLKNR